MATRESSPGVLERKSSTESSAEQAVGAVGRRDFVRGTAAAVAVGAFGGSTLLNVAKAAAPVWQKISHQFWEVGESVFLDLSEFVSDVDGDELVLSLNAALPPGLSFDGTAISGVPTTVSSTTIYTAIADDGTPDEVLPNPPDSLTLS